MKVKRFTLLVLLLALTTTLLVACDGDATTTAGSACPYHGYDRQGDGVCDNCGEPFCASDHTNRNNDNYCDWCGMFLAGGGQTTAITTAAMPAEARFTITSDDLACNVGGDNVTFSVAAVAMPARPLSLALTAIPEWTGTKV